MGIGIGKGTAEYCGAVRSTNISQSQGCAFAKAPGVVSREYPGEHLHGGFFPENPAGLDHGLLVLCGPFVGVNELFENRVNRFRGGLALHQFLALPRQGRQFLHGAAGFILFNEHHRKIQHWEEAEAAAPVEGLYSALFPVPPCVEPSGQASEALTGVQHRGSEVTLTCTYEVVASYVSHESPGKRFGEHHGQPSYHSVTQGESVVIVEGLEVDNIHIGC